MGTNISKYTFIPKENEQIDAVIKIAEEPRSVIHGVVKDEKGRLVRDAVVKLFKSKDHGDHCILTPITHAFTDECGQFIFGPLIPGVKYVIKVWVNDVKICRVEEENSEAEWEGICDDDFDYGDTTRKKKIPVKVNDYQNNYNQR